MKKHLLTALTILLASTASYAADANDDYPMTKEERDAKEMGSVLGGEGIVIRPGETRSEAIVPAEGNFNKFLWQASQEMVDIAPLTLVDSKNGTLSTDWYSSKEMPDTSTKLTVKIVGSTLTAGSLDVKVQQRSMKNGRWVEETAKPRVVSDMTAKILKRANELKGK